MSLYGVVFICWLLVVVVVVTVVAFVACLGYNHSLFLGFGLYWILIRTAAGLGDNWQHFVGL